MGGAPLEGPVDRTLGTTTAEESDSGAFGGRAGSEALTNQPAQVGAPLQPAVVKRRLMVADGLAAAFGVALAFAIQSIVKPIPGYLVFDHALLYLASTPSFVAGAVMCRLYHARANERPTNERLNVVRAVSVGVAFMVLFAFITKFGGLSRLWVVLVFVCMSAALLVERGIARRVFHRLRSTGRLVRRIVIVGTDAHAIGLLHTYIRNPTLGYQVLGFVGDDDIGERAGARVLGRLDELEKVLAEHSAVGVVVSLSGVESGYVNRITRRLTDDGYHVSLSSSLADIDVTRLRPQSLDGRTMIYVEPIVRDGLAAASKRIFDIAAASFILLVTAPLWAVAAVAIKLQSKGPVFFRQQRVGFHGALFTLVKFRTMVVDAEQQRAALREQSDVDGPLFKMHDDPRITRVGRILRRFSIDELPQLVSVIKGDMSMVGPRPALPDEVAEWEPAMFERLRVLPGLTGMWQVSGRSNTSFEQYRRLDLYYVDNWSLAHDLRICLRTFGTVLGGRGSV